MIKATVVVGNPKSNSRTARIAESLARLVLGGADSDIQIIDLADDAGQVFTWPSEHMDDLTARVASSDLVIFACPTYKANYTGLLKSFLDRYPANGLRNVTAIAVMTGADLSHSMSPTFTLVPLLLELGAAVPCRGIYFNTSQMDKVDAQIATSADEVVRTIRNIAGVSNDLRPVSAHVEMVG